MMSSRSIERRLSRAEKKLKQHMDGKELVMANTTSPKRVTWTCSRCAAEQSVGTDPTRHIDDPLPDRWRWIDQRDSTVAWLLCDRCVEAHDAFMAGGRK